jgi:hypothetical protein
MEVTEYFKEFSDLYTPPYYNLYSGDKGIKLPVFTLSYEDPPGKNGEYDYESYLGVYDDKKDGIIIFLKGIMDCAKDLQLDYKRLATIVLLHELGHWVFYKVLFQGFKNSNSPCWDYEKHKILHETFAQLFAAVLIKDCNALFAAFKELNKKQSRPYQFWEKPFNSLVKENIQIPLPPNISDKDQYLKILRSFLTKDLYEKLDSCFTAREFNLC